jgi:hypothetical protein
LIRPTSDWSSPAWGWIGDRSDFDSPLGSRKVLFQFCHCDGESVGCGCFCSDGGYPRSHLFLAAAGLAGAAWTMAASELWVAGREARLIHLRNGAFSWRLHEDLDRVNTYRVEMMVPSWTEYLLEQERLTKDEAETIEKAFSLHTGETPPVIRQFFCVNRELHTRHHQVARPSSMAEAPLGIDSVAPSATA